MSCQHTLTALARAGEYVRCGLCGTFRSTAPQVDYAANYWSGDKPSLYEQAYNCDLHIENGCSKSKFILDRIASDRGAALEIGCAPGRMLYWLRWAARFQEVWGIDPSDKVTVDRISANAADVLMQDVFQPKTVTGSGITSNPAFAYILAADVFEHSTEPIPFLAACARLLKPGGQLFLMLPLSDQLPADSRFFAPKEHAYLHSKSNMQAMMEDAGFGRIVFDQWCLGHDTVSGIKQ